MVLKFGEISRNLVGVRPLPRRGRRARSGFARRTPDKQTPRSGPGVARADAAATTQLLTGRDAVAQPDFG